MIIRRQLVAGMSSKAIISTIPAVVHDGVETTSSPWCSTMLSGATALQPSMEMNRLWLVHPARPGAAVAPNGAPLCHGRT